MYKYIDHDHLPCSSNVNIFCYPINFLWPNDAIWQIRSGSILALLIACCLMAPSHYLNKCRLIISNKHCPHCEGNLTHWGRVMHICVSKVTIIGSDNGLSPGRRQATIWSNAGILLIRPLGTNFCEILIGVQTFSFRKMELKMSSAKWRPFVSAKMS